VEAQYPDAALRNGIQGYVDVQFTITPQGTVTDVAVVHSDPGDIFNRAAVDAVSQWRYDPRVVDGRAVESQSQARVRFKLDSSLAH
jgi:protein TonB